MWQKYVRKRGSLNVGRRVESGAALVGYIVARGNGAKVEYRDLAPHEDHKKPRKTDQDMRDLYKWLSRSAR